MNLTSSSSLKPFHQNDSRSLSTSLLPRPTQLPLPQPSSSTLLTHVQRRRPSHIPQLKPSFSSNSNGTKTVLTATTSSQSSHSTSNNLSVLSHSSALLGTHSSPLKMVGQQQVNARVLAHCLGTQLFVDDSGAVVNVQSQQQQQQHHSVNTTKRKRFIFDHAFHENTTIQDMMPALYPLLRQSLYGYHGTVLNYGPTGCGKSLKMLGSQNETGLIFRSLETLFDMMYKDIGIEFILRASYYEVYQEDLYDLLCPSNSNIDLHETKKKSAFVAPLTEEIITSPTDVLRIIQKGQANLYLCPDKHTYQESHVVFQLIIESHKCSNRPRKSNVPAPSLSSTSSSSSNPSSTAKRVTISQLMFIDLAESNSPPPTSSTADLQNNLSRRRSNRKDTGLAAFESRVIQLTGKEQRYTPIDTKKNTLARLLEPSLTGKTNLLSICTINDKNHPYEYLKFSHRLRKLLVSPKINDENEIQSVLLRHRSDRIKLKHKLKQLDMESEQGDHSKLLRAALTRQLTYNQEQVIANEKYLSTSSAMEPSSSTSSTLSNSSSLSSLLAAATIAKAMTDKMEGFQAYDWSLINELDDEKNRLQEQNQSLLHQLALMEQQVATMEQQKYVLDNINFLQDELRVAKTELEVTKLLVHKA